jgi:hypothetical protein
MAHAQKPVLNVPSVPGSLLLSQQLLMSVAEQIKLPLLQIARQTELARLHGAVKPEALHQMQNTADKALSLLDN